MNKASRGRLKAAHPARRRSGRREWEQTLRDERGPLRHPNRQIDRQQGDRGSPNGRPPDEDRPLPAEVPRPFVTAGVEEPDLLSGPGIDTRQIGSFVVVVRQASEGQVGSDRAAAMLLRNDVMDLEASRRER